MIRGDVSVGCSTRSSSGGRQAARLGCVPTLTDVAAVPPPEPAATGCDRDAVDRHAPLVGEDGATVFDRVGARAWRLAVRIVDDPRRADEIVVDTFTGFSDASGRIVVDDARLLCDVHRRSRAVAAESPANTSPRCRRSDRGTGRHDSGIAVATVRTAVIGLPEPQRTMIELAVFGGLSVTAIAAVIGVARSAVLMQLSDGMRTIKLARICGMSSAAHSPIGTEFA